jgi:hypothetical protein
VKAAGRAHINALGRRACIHMHVEKNPFCPTLTCPKCCVLTAGLNYVKVYFTLTFLEIIPQEKT